MKTVNDLLRPEGARAPDLAPTAEITRLRSLLRALNDRIAAQTVAGRPPSFAVVRLLGEIHGWVLLASSAPYAQAGAIRNALKSCAELDIETRISVEP